MFRQMKSGEKSRILQSLSIEMSSSRGVIMSLTTLDPVNQSNSSPVIVSQSLSPEFADILTPEALDFLGKLHRQFNPQRQQLLQARERLQTKLDQGWQPDFLKETQEIRQKDWTIAGIPPDLQDRRVEITGPVDRKMIINALNSGANAFMADFEDSCSPTGENIIAGQINLRDAVNGTIEYRDEAKGKAYHLNPETAVLMVRPRGWHLLEEHLVVDGEPMSASLVDFGLYFWHNARNLLNRGTAPYFYLPKLENHQEAQLWNDVFVAAQEALDIPIGTIKATVLIETILAAFEMDEILYVLRDHIVALNCGRWDYIFSYIKKFRQHREYILPDRQQVTMTRHFLRSYSLLTIKTCHRRGAMAMGGMSAQIPIKNDPEANKIALAKVRADKEREAEEGHDGTWVAHPGLVSLAKKVFDEKMPKANQIERKREDITVTASDLLAVPDGTITEEGVRQNIRVGILYLTAWLDGKGCVPLFNLMEDAATAEISRTQLWQWLRYEVRLEEGRILDYPVFNRFLAQEVAVLRQEHSGTSLETAIALFTDLVTAETFPEFLTLSAYRQLSETQK